MVQNMIVICKEEINKTHDMIKNGIAAGKKGVNKTNDDKKNIFFHCMIKDTTNIIIFQDVSDLPCLTGKKHYYIRT